MNGRRNAGSAAWSAGRGQWDMTPSQPIGRAPAGIGRSDKGDCDLPREHARLRFDLWPETGRFETEPKR